MNHKKTIRIGTRGSELALWQANRVKDLLIKAEPSNHYLILPIVTKGDVNTKDSISQIGGKGIFLKEIELALVNNDIDIAIHSFKDITAIPNKELAYSGFILEESVTDSFILFNDKSLTDQLVIATGSLRRKALMKEYYPQVKCIEIRGNIQTRIESAKKSGADGLMLSTAGLQRLGLTDLISHECNPNQFIPAPGQGIIAIQHRSNEPEIVNKVKAITQKETNDLALNYYAILEELNFNCDIPFGAYINAKQELKLFYEKNNVPTFVTTQWSKKDEVKRSLKSLINNNH